MDKIEITGGKSLNGKIRISGSKNSALPILAASLLTEEKISVSNVPNLSDIFSMLELLKSLNVKINKRKDKIDLTSSTPRSLLAHYDLVRKMRASFLILGPLLARYGEAKVSLPGGCAIGNRPVNLHLDGLERMGVTFKIEDGYVTGSIDGRLKGANINLNKISVGATENLIMAATLAEGTTIITNAAQEPEISDLSKLLIRMGANIKGFGTKKIVIDGVKKLKSCSYEIMPDRIESGTYILCVFGCGGIVKLENVNNEICDHLIKIFKQLKSLQLKKNDNGKNLADKKKKNSELSLKVRTKEYPGFPTDLQAQLTSSLLKTKGRSEIVENIFENRFMHIGELIRMGANVKQIGSKVIVKKCKKLRGAEVMATDLRASSCLVIAALMADGKTTINRVYHLDRGYENLEKKLKIVWCTNKKGEVLRDIILAIPKGRILNELIPLLKKVDIEPEQEFFDDKSRKLMFRTNKKNLSIIKVRAFDVATFVALGAAQIGIAGDDVLNEFDYDEIYKVLDLGIGKCRLSVAKKIKVNKENFQSNGHIMVATKYKNTVINFFANKGVRAECIKLNGAIELAPRLGICSTIVDLVSTGRTLKENNLRESDVLLEITSKLIVNKISYKIMNSEISKIITKFSRIING